MKAKAGETKTEAGETKADAGETKADAGVRAISNWNRHWALARNWKLK